MIKFLENQAQRMRRGVITKLIKLHKSKLRKFGRRKEKDFLLL